MPQIYFEQSHHYLLKGFTQREANEGKYLDQFISTYPDNDNTQNLNKIEQLHVEGTHKSEANEGTYLDQLNNNNM